MGSKSVWFKTVRATQRGSFGRELLSWCGVLTSLGVWFTSLLRSPVLLRPRKLPMEAPVAWLNYSLRSEGCMGFLLCKGPPSPLPGGRSEQPD